MTKPPRKEDWMRASAYLEADDRVEVVLDTPANVMLMDDVAYQAYTRGEDFKYVGGWAKRSPIEITPPRPGHWNVVVDLAGEQGRVGARVEVIRGKDRD